MKQRRDQWSVVINNPILSVCFTYIIFYVHQLNIMHGLAGVSLVLGSQGAVTLYKFVGPVRPESRFLIDKNLP